MKTLRIVSADMGAAESLYTMLVRNKQFRVLPILRDGRELLERSHRHTNKCQRPALRRGLDKRFYSNWNPQTYK